MALYTISLHYCKITIRDDIPNVNNDIAHSSVPLSGIMISDENVGTLRFQCNNIQIRYDNIATNNLSTIMSQLSLTKHLSSFTNILKLQLLIKIPLREDNDYTILLPNIKLQLVMKMHPLSISYVLKSQR